MSDADDPVAVSPKAKTGPSGPPVEPPRYVTRFTQRLALFALKGFTAKVRRMSAPDAHRFGERLGALGYFIDRRRRRVAARNLRLAFGDLLSPREREAIIRGTFTHWGVTTVDFLRNAALDADQMNALVSEVEGWEWVEAARARGGGMLFVTGHLGNFEFLGRWMAAQGIPSTVIARDPADPALAAYLREMREFGGNVALSKKVTSVRQLLTLLKQGQTVTLGADQSSGDLFVPFFGVPAGTVAGPAALARLTKTPLLPAFCVREPDGRYRMIFLPPIEVAHSDDRDADIARAMSAVNDVVESVIRRFPLQWLWLHNRWKSAFQEIYRDRWPQDGSIDFDTAKRRWLGE